MSPFRRSSRYLLFAAIAGVFQCGGGDDLTLPPEGLPAAIETLEGNGQTGVVGQRLNDSLMVRLTDSRDRPVAGQRIQFTAVTRGEGAQLQPDTAVTDANGVARSGWVLGRDPGLQEVVAKVISPVASGTLSARFTATARADRPASIVPISGNNQTGTVRDVLEDSLVVRVTDRFGNPVAGQTVRWTVPDGEGRVSSATTTTGGNGRTAVTRTLGSHAGTQTARATCDALSGQVVVFTHEAVSDKPKDLVKLSPDQQRAPAGTALPDPLVVQARDADGNPVPGQSITWSASSGGSVSPGSSTTNAEGKASTTWTLSSTAGPNTLTAAGFGVTATYTAIGTTAGAAPTNTTIASDDPDPSTAGQVYAVTFRVGSFAGIPTGSVTVGDGSASCTGSLFLGIGSCQLASTTAGSKTLTAIYSGDGTFEPSSDTESHRVDPAVPSSSYGSRSSPAMSSGGRRSSPRSKAPLSTSR